MIEKLESGKDQLANDTKNFYEIFISLREIKTNITEPILNITEVGL